MGCFVGIVEHFFGYGCVGCGVSLVGCFDISRSIDLTMVVLVWLLMDVMSLGLLCGEIWYDFDGGDVGW